MLPRMDLRPEYLTPLMEFLKILDIPMPEVRDIHQEYCCPFVQKGSAAITWSGDICPCIALMHSYRCYILGREKFIFAIFFYVKRFRQRQGVLIFSSFGLSDASVGRLCHFL